MKARVERNQVCNVVFRGIKLHQLDNLAQFFELFFADALRRPESGLTLQQVTNRGNILKVFRGKALDHNPAIWVRGDKVFEFELFECLAHGSSAHAKLFCNFHLDQAVARLIAPFGNPVP
ncbi:hypothetical protein SDC9_209612 [bioreactor metagenome]|uniref:Uncharacterized protein n=1 Tax=bioreactor metagenome TaxID=1076179 RepID=A0A645JET1_9ZZZZ